MEKRDEGLGGAESSLSISGPLSGVYTSKRSMTRSSRPTSIGPAALENQSALNEEKRTRNITKKRKTRDKMLDDDLHSPRSRKKPENKLGPSAMSFIELLKSKPDRTMDLNEASDQLKVAKRRIYDITNVLEGLGVVEKTTKNTVEWTGAWTGLRDPDDLITPDLHSLRQEERALDEKHAQVGDQTQLLASNCSLTDQQILQAHPSFAPHTNIIAVSTPLNYATDTSHANRLVIKSNTSALDFTRITPYLPGDVNFTELPNNTSSNSYSGNNSSTSPEFSTESPQTDNQMDYQSHQFSIFSPNRNTPGRTLFEASPHPSSFPPWITPPKYMPTSQMTAESPFNSSFGSPSFLAPNSSTYSGSIDSTDSEWKVAEAPSLSTLFDR